MPIASIHLGAQQAQPLQPYCSGNIAGDRQECQSCFPCSSPLLLLWLGTLFSRLAARPEKHQQQLRRPAQASPLGGKERCLWLSGARHIHAHGFSYLTLPFLGTRAPPVSHRWCLEPPVSLWWHSSASAHCWALAEQVW